MHIDQKLVSQVTAQGWAFIHRFESTLSSDEAFACLGTVDHVEGLNAVQTLLPRRADEAPPNTYSGNFGTNQFPLHTDLAHWYQPPRFVALRCLHGAAEVATHLIDSNTLIHTIGAHALRRALVQPRRPVKNRKQLLRLLERVDGLSEYRIRWDSIYLQPATTYSKQVFAEVLAFLSEAITTNVVLLETGDVLVIDNWRMLHGRAPIHKYGCARHIERTYIKELK
jgi:L-asparagine oxygenase